MSPPELPGVLSGQRAVRRQRRALRRWAPLAARDGGAHELLDPLGGVISTAVADCKEGKASALARLVATPLRHCPRLGVQGVQRPLGFLLGQRGDSLLQLLLRGHGADSTAATGYGCTDFGTSRGSPGFVGEPAVYCAGHLRSGGRASETVRTAIVASLCAIAVALTLGACGGASSSKPSSTAASSPLAELHTTTAGQRSGTGLATTGAAPHAGKATSAKHPTSAVAKAHASALDACLRSHGLAVSGSSSPATGQPKAVSASRYRDALRACAAGSPASTAGKTPGRVLSPRFRDALVSFAACMRRNGLNLAAPNTSGKGPIFSTKGVDVRSVAFRTAERNCRSTLTTTAKSAGGPGKK